MVLTQAIISIAHLELFYPSTGRNPQKKFVKCFVIPKKNCHLRRKAFAVTKLIPLPNIPVHLQTSTLLPYCNSSFLQQQRPMSIFCVMVITTNSRLLFHFISTHPFFVTIPSLSFKQLMGREKIYLF